MIQVSNRRKDSIFVARTLRTYKLGPTPVDGYYDQPDYRRCDGGWERVIERYPWGTVLYIDRPGASATMVIRGNFNPATGEVEENGRTEVVPAAWYGELVRRCEMVKMETPGCAGYWVAGVTCDGGPNADTGKSEDVCSWRRRCRLIQNHLVGLETDPKAYRSRYGEEALNRLLARLEKGAKPKQTRTKRKKSRKAPRKLTTEQKRERRYAPLKEMAADFYQELSKAVDRRRVVCCERRTEAVRPGCIYLVDRTAKGVYINIYMRLAKGRAHKLAVIRLAPINGGLDIQLPDDVAPSDLLADLRWVSWNESPMASVVRTLKTPDHYRWMAERLAADALRVLEM